MLDRFGDHVFPAYIEPIEYFGTYIKTRVHISTGSVVSLLPEKLGEGKEKIILVAPADCSGRHGIEEFEAILERKRKKCLTATREVYYCPGAVIELRWSACIMNSRLS